MAGKDQAVKLSLPRASSLNENVDHSALLKLGGTVSERVNRFDSKSGGEGGCSTGFSKLQETRRIFEQRTLQVKRLFALLTFLCCVNSRDAPTVKFYTVYPPAVFFYSKITRLLHRKRHIVDFNRQGSSNTISFYRWLILKFSRCIGASLVNSFLCLQVCHRSMSDW